MRKFKEYVKQTFKMIDLGEMAYFLGMELKQKNEKCLFVKGC